MPVAQIFSCGVQRKLTLPIQTSLGTVRDIKIISPNHPMMTPPVSFPQPAQIEHIQIGQIVETPFGRFRVNNLISDQLELQRFFESREIRACSFLPGYGVGVAAVLRRGQEEADFAVLSQSGLAPAAVFAEDFSGPEIFRINPEQVKIFGLDGASVTSHIFEIPKAKGILSFWAASRRFRNIQPGDVIAADGLTGRIWVNPDETNFTRIWGLSQNFNDFVEEIRRQNMDFPAVTRDSREVLLCASIERIAETNLLRSFGLDCVGVFRTEAASFSTAAPSEDELFEQYQLGRSVAEQLKFITFRTFNIQPHSQLPFLPFPFEEFEPGQFGGLGISLGFLLEGRREEIFEPFYRLFQKQVRAILRISALYPGKVRLMFPLVLDARQFSRAKGEVLKIKEQMKHEGVAFDDRVKIGSMIETQSAALGAREIAGEADFLQIGSNDLVGSFFQIPRGGFLTEAQGRIFHPAFLTLVSQIVYDAQKQEKYLGMCGDAAFDLLAVPLWLGAGLTGLSGPSSLAPLLKHLVRGIYFEDLASAVPDLKKCRDEKEMSAVLRDFYRGLQRQHRFPEEPFFVELLK